MGNKCPACGRSSHTAPPIKVNPPQTAAFDRSVAEVFTYFVMGLMSVGAVVIMIICLYQAFTA